MERNVPEKASHFSADELDIIHGRMPLSDAGNLSRKIVAAIEHLGHHGNLENHHAVTGPRSVVKVFESTKLDKP